MTRPQAPSPASVGGGSERVDEGGHGAAVQRVAALEHLFDPVFVFTLTQLTHLLTEEPSPAGIAQVLLIFGVSGWMHGGYAWLTNHQPLDRPEAP